MLTAGLHELLVAADALLSAKHSIFGRPRELKSPKLLSLLELRRPAKKVWQPKPPLVIPGKIAERAAQRRSLSQARTDVSTTATNPAEHLRRRQAAEYLKVSESTLAHWAWLGTGPRFSRTGDKRGVVTYSVADLRAWLESRTVEAKRETR